MNNNETQNERPTEPLTQVLGSPRSGMFRKRPVSVFASVWERNGDHPKDDCFRPFEDTGKVPTEPREGAIVRYFRHPTTRAGQCCMVCGGLLNDHGFIDTLEGGHIVCPGDYIITGVRGEFYPCKPGIFADTYEPCSGGENTELRNAANE